MSSRPPPLPRQNRGPKIFLVLASLGAVATMTYATISRSIDKERMYKGVKFDVERMREKKPEGLGSSKIVDAPLKEAEDAARRS